MTGKRRTAQKPVTQLAKGQTCQIRLVGICNHNPETVVPCHYRMHGLSGFGFIPSELFVAHGCSACHAYCDSHHDAETRLSLAEAVFRTQSALLRQGVIAIGKAA